MSFVFKKNKCLFILCARTVWDKTICWIMTISKFCVFLTSTPKCSVMSIRPKFCVIHENLLIKPWKLYHAYLMKISVNWLLWFLSYRYELILSFPSAKMACLENEKMYLKYVTRRGAPWAQFLTGLCHECIDIKAKAFLYPNM